MRKPALKSPKAALKTRKGTTASPESAGLSSPRPARIGEALKADIAKGRVPGAALPIERYGKTVYWEAFGAHDPATGAALERNGIFRIYSMTKPICSVAVPMLAEEGRRLLSDPSCCPIPSASTSWPWPSCRWRFRRAAARRWSPPAPTSPFRICCGTRPG